MSTARRLANLETKLPADQALTLWLADAHRHRSMPEYVAWLLDQPRSAWPLVHLPEQAELAVRAREQGPPAVVDERVRRARQDAAFLARLVMAISVETYEELETVELRGQLLATRARQLGAEAALPDALDDQEARRTLLQAYDALAAEVRAHLRERMAADEARSALEARYLAGAPALWPDLREATAALRSDAEALARAIVPVRGEPPDPDELSGEVRELGRRRASRLRELVRAKLLAEVGQQDRARAIIEPRIRAEVAP